MIEVHWKTLIVYHNFDTTIICFYFSSELMYWTDVFLDFCTKHVSDVNHIFLCVNFTHLIK